MRCVISFHCERESWYTHRRRFLSPSKIEVEEEEEDNKREISSAWAYRAGRGGGLAEKVFFLLLCVTEIKSSRKIFPLIGSIRPAVF